MVSGGQEAIDAYREAISDDPPRGYDIVFMDLSMPTVSGFEATAAIREFEKQSKRSHEGEEGPPVGASIIALTGLVSAKDRHAAFSAGVDQYLTKPASVKDVANIVEQWRDGKLKPASAP